MNGYLTPNDPPVCTAYRAREMREVAFTRKHSTLAIAADTVADALCDRVIGSVASEIGGFVGDYSKHYVTKL